MRLALLVLLAVTAAPAAGQNPVRERPVPLPHPGQQWIRTTSPNFTIISSAGLERTRDVAQTLETVAGAIRRVHPRFDARFTDTTVLLFNRRGDSQPLFDLLMNQPRVNAPGAFIVQPDGSAVIVVDGGRDVGRTIRHELMHNILAASGTHLPLWLEEGIAEYFSTTTVRGDSVIVGRPIVAHYRSLMRGVLPVDDVLAARSDSPVATHLLFYAQSWALVEWMMRTNRRFFYDFVADVEKGDEATVAFRRRFSMDIGTVARSFRAPIARPSASSQMEIERSEVPIAEEPISAADALYELATFLGKMEDTRDDAERFLQAALELDPDHARSIAGIGTLRTYDKKFEQATELFEKALKVGPDDPSVQLQFAQALLRHAVGPFAGATNLDGDSQTRFRRARQLALTAHAARPSPLAEAIIGTSYLVEEDASPGIAPLERACAARPARHDFALNLYAIYLRNERREEAGRLFAAVFENARHPQTVLAARSIFVRESIIHTNRLIEADRLDEAVLHLAETIEGTTDPFTRADLVMQADKLARVVERNRQVLLYNEAVAAFNRGDPRAALEHSESLLIFATDPDICAAAERIKVRARKRLGM